MKILVVSDIHGNLAALEAVHEKADVVFCLGDIVNYGPHPKACIKRIQDLTDKVVRGNHDNAVGSDVDCGCSAKYKELSDAGKIFTRTGLNEYEREFLENLPVTLNIKLDEIKFLLSHGSPGGDLYKYLRPDVRSGLGRKAIYRILSEDIEAHRAEAVRLMDDSSINRVLRAVEKEANGPSFLEK
ncbi:MAG: metallophosphoesterase, partial [Planctomycetota bacterium]